MIRDTETMRIEHNPKRKLNEMTAVSPREKKT
jgi:hypothetical protein